MKKIPFSLILLTLFLTGCRSSILDDPSMVVSFTVAQRSHVKLTIENSYNTVIATLIDDDLSPGSYRANFNSNDLQEGVYFSTLESTTLYTNQSTTRTKSLLLIK